MQKRQERGGFFFHAKDDYPDVRKVFFDFLRELPFSLEVFVGRKISRLFIAKHNANEDEFYADLLSHLLKNKMNKERLVLNVAARGNSTRMAVLESAARKAEQRFLAKNHGSETRCKIVFNVQTPLSEPLLAYQTMPCGQYREYLKLEKPDTTTHCSRLKRYRWWSIFTTGRGIKIGGTTTATPQKDLRQTIR